MKTVKTLLLIGSVILMYGAASAASFGTYSSAESKTVDSLDASFSIKAFNLGDRPLKLEVSSEELEDARVVHPQSITLEPSEVTSDPSPGGDWFLRSDGKYVETTEIPVRLFIDGSRSSDRFNFDVTISASTQDEGGEGVFQNIAQVRSYSFEVETTSISGETNSDQSIVGTDESGGNASEEGLTRFASRNVERVEETLSGFTQGLSEDSEQDTAEEVQTEKDQTSASNATEASERVFSDTGGDKEETKNRSTGNFFQAIGANFVTILLVLGIAGSTLYLFRVI